MRWRRGASLNCTLNHNQVYSNHNHNVEDQSTEADRQSSVVHKQFEEVFTYLLTQSPVESEMTSEKGDQSISV